MGLIREMLTEWPELIVGWLIVGAICLLVFIGLDLATGHRSTVYGVVAEKAYTPANTSTGIGMTSTGDGVGTTVLVSSTPESYTVIIRADDGWVFSYDLKPEDYVRYDKGDDIAVEVWFGGITGWKF